MADQSIILWILAGIFTFTGLAGLLLPLVPGAPLLFLGLLLGAWAAIRLPPGLASRFRGLPWIFLFRLLEVDMRLNMRMETGEKNDNNYNKEWQVLPD